MKTGSYRFTAPTADIGLAVRAPDRRGLFVQAFRGTLHLALGYSPAPQIGKTGALPVRFSGDGYENLLVLLLSDLIYRLDTDSLLPADLRVTGLDSGQFSGMITQIPRVGCLARAIKAVTYHGLKIRKQPAGGYAARIIFDV